MWPEETVIGGKLMKVQLKKNEFTAEEQHGPASIAGYGTTIHADQGDFLITTPIGTQFVVSAEQFKENFEEFKKKKPPPKKKKKTTKKG